MLIYSSSCPIHFFQNRGIKAIFTFQKKHKLVSVTQLVQVKLNVSKAPDRLCSVIMRDTVSVLLNKIPIVTNEE